MINWVGVIQETLMITSFVIIMMLLIEFVNVVSKGKLVKLLNRNSYIQIIAGTLLGIIPGCMGTFAVVSLYSQKVVSFGTLVATMIATSGDEAYFILAMMPKQAFILFGILGVLALATGIVVDKVFKNKSLLKTTDPVITESHSHDCSHSHDNQKIFSFKNFSFNRYRLYLIAIISAVIILAATGWIGHSHSETLLFSLPSESSTENIHINDIAAPEHDHHHDHECGQDHHHSDNCEHGHGHGDAHMHAGHSHEHGEADIIKIIIIVSSVLLLFIILFCNEHFVKEHLWDHIIKRHLPKIFLWILGTLIVINIVLNLTDIGSWIYDNLYIVLLIAVLIGIIPQSGPHLIFLILFMQGTIPFSILLANSIVQDGHGALPLLAESKKSFVVMKLISIGLGLFIGAMGLLTGFF